MNVIAQFTEYCVRKDIISSSDAEWFSYGLVQRCEKLITLCFLFPLGWLLSSFSASFAFYLSFFLLRVRTNGYHSKTFAGCLLFSDFTEFESYCTPLGPCIVNHHDFLVCPLRSSEPSHDEGRTGSIKTYGNANRANIGYGANSEFEHAVLCLRQWTCTRTRLYCLFTNNGIRKADI